MREKMFYVYKIICIKDEWNGKFYIGSHYGYVNDIYTGSGRKIKEYFKLYGKDDTYIKEILEISDNEIYIKNKEKEIIRENIENNLCLNMAVHSGKSTVGKSTWNKGKSLSEEHSRKISESLKGKQPLINHKWINNGIIQTLVHISLLDDYLKNGWHRGRKLSI